MGFIAFLMIVAGFITGLVAIASGWAVVPLAVAIGLVVFGCKLWGHAADKREEQRRAGVPRENPAGDTFFGWD